MPELAIGDWKEFQVSDILDYQKPRVYHKRELISDADGVNYVTRTKFNNGVTDRVRSGNLEELELNPAGVISFGAENAKFFYQIEEFVSGRDIYYLETQSLTKNTALFLTTCLNSFTYKYSYNFGMFPEHVMAEEIKLPVSPSGRPDWDFMDSYMIATFEELDGRLALLQSVIE